MAPTTNKPYTTDSSKTINPGMLGDRSNQNSGRLIYLELDVLKSRPFANDMKTIIRSYLNEDTPFSNLFP